jgi:uncharacterized caspase-like protein
VVGVNRFHDREIPRLGFARADAEAVAALLCTRIQEPHREVHLLVDEKATKRNILRAVTEEIPRREAADDVILLYFACHGSPEMAGAPNATSLYLAVHDTEYDRIFSTGIEMAYELPLWISRFQRAKLVLVVLDACFSGAAGGRTFEGPALQRLPNRRGAPISLSEIDFGEGRLILSASGDRQLALESDTLRHGVFTYHLLKELGRPASGGATVGVFTLYQNVAEGVKQETNGRQVPVLNGRGVLPWFPLLG